MGIIAYGVYYLTIPYLRNSASVILAIIAGIISYTMFVIMFNVITEEELKKLQKELEHAQGFLAAVRKKLSNEKFVNSAPAQVVDIERKKEADALAKIATIEKAIDTLSK